MIKSLKYMFTPKKKIIERIEELEKSNKEILNTLKGIEQYNKEVVKTYTSLFYENEEENEELNKGQKSKKEIDKIVKQYKEDIDNFFE